MLSLFLRFLLLNLLVFAEVSFLYFTYTYIFFFSHNFILSVVKVHTNMFAVAFVVTERVLMVKVFFLQ